MSEGKNVIERLDYIRSELHFLLDEIVVLEDQVKNSDKSRMEMVLTSDSELLQDIHFLKSIFTKDGVTNNHYKNVVETNGLAYGT